MFKKIDDNILPSLMKYRDDKFRACDSTYGILYLWKDYFKCEYVIINDCLVIKFTEEGKTDYSCPYGYGDKAGAVRLLFEYLGKNITLSTYDTADVEFFKTNYNAEIDTERDWADYLYLASDLINLSGKKYHGQRGHVNRFMREYPGYKYINIKKFEPRLIEFLDEYYILASKQNVAEYEREPIIKLLTNLEGSPFACGYTEVDGKITGMSIGELRGDTLYVHIEKALRNYHGAAEMQNRVFVMNNPGAVYVNREDDAGDPGLRTAKLSYHPHSLIEKFTIRIK